jgi:hypothetical protein
VLKRSSSEEKVWKGSLPDREEAAELKDSQLHDASRFTSPMDEKGQQD